MTSFLFAGAGCEREPRVAVQVHVPPRPATPNPGRHRLHPAQRVPLAYCRTAESSGHQSLQGEADLSNHVFPERIQLLLTYSPVNREGHNISGRNTNGQDTIENLIYNFSFVQSTCLEKPICAPPRLSEYIIYSMGHRPT